MALPPIFPFRPTVETESETTFRTLEAQFGDGYKQSVGDGINIKRESWDVSFRGTWARNSNETVSNRVYISEVKTFLDTLQGFHPFRWTPKNGVQAMFEFKSYKIINHHNGIFTLTTKFSQIF